MKIIGISFKIANFSWLVLNNYLTFILHFNNYRLFIDLCYLYLIIKLTRYCVNTLRCKGGGCKTLYYSHAKL